MGRHRALIHWSPAQRQLGLPTVLQTIDPAWIPEQTEGWSLVVDFIALPAVSESPTSAFVAFLMEGAPECALYAGARLALYERQTGQRACVEVLD